VTNHYNFVGGCFFGRTRRIVIDEIHKNGTKFEVCCGYNIGHSTALVEGPLMADLHPTRLAQCDPTRRLDCAPASSAFDMRLCGNSTFAADGKIASQVDRV
jgi:hypothetical protein